ncbi:SDR family NAD(P)-dependent oxidoreductase [Kordiimonas sp.]|uniref:SDR family NAD(P)-dependent oxidoreductase n=1 Tax=Kordiimonas sp. TaxID=1970157 RepID=UPI003A8D5B3A
MTDKKTIALITGGGSGIGLATARLFTNKGFKVILAGRDRDRLQAACDHLPGTIALPLDVTDSAAVTLAFSNLASQAQTPDILVNNAGAAKTAPFHRISVADWQAALDVNLTGAFLCTQAVLPTMKKAGYGRIITVASTAGLKGYAYTAAYTAAKHGVIGMTRALALEIAGSGVTANTVCPGFTDTDIVRKSIDNIVEKTGRSTDDAMHELTRHNPAGRLIRPEEVADAIYWLARPEADAMNGQAIAVAGGEVM